MLSIIILEFWEVKIKFEILPSVYARRRRREAFEV